MKYFVPFAPPLRLCVALNDTLVEYYHSSANLLRPPSRASPFFRELLLHPPSRLPAGEQGEPPFQSMETRVKPGETFNF